MMMVIPAGLIHTFGIMAGNRKQGWLLFWMVFIIYIVAIVIVAIAEYQGNPLVNSILGGEQPNLEGKEVRFAPLVVYLDNNANLLHWILLQSSMRASVLLSP